ncbi:hypothetical protein [Serpentinicella alkaliphila]|uniref:SnoaL-like protein n=1 Tax=Serpentinicella alkaliphila TaxID=1734049 RepID=A0A4V2T217_9FIRM|nr:hypothetical protein [Serpentinicella alkaliphila]QUH26191.1 hypothetical protein HZR23_10935 [Serpentinicella alkaliphila]TCP95713.1 hypothetical protein EDD79_10579 [Serpentinicella alkaliphila]
MTNETEVEKVINKFYEIISGKAEDGRDWCEFRRLFYSEDSSLTSMKYNNKECITKPLNVEEYIVVLRNFLKSKDFYEYGFNYEIKVYESIANVYSEYAAKPNKEDTEIIKRGVNIAQFIFNGLTWKIHSMLWQDQV